MGKSAEVPLAISKASLDAKKNMFHVPVTEQGTIPHEVLGHFGAGRIIIKPAVEGTGVIAGGAVRPRASRSSPALRTSRLAVA